MYIKGQLDCYLQSLARLRKCSPASEIVTHKCRDVTGKDNHTIYFIIYCFFFEVAKKQSVCASSSSKRFIKKDILSNRLSKNA